MAESHLIKDIKATFKNHPDIDLRRTNTGGMRRHGAYIEFNVKGTPDFCGVMRGGRAVYVECKDGDEELEPDQIKFRDRVVRLGALYVEARSVDDVWRALKG